LESRIKELSSKLTYGTKIGDKSAIW
jgi:hypothetical protein